jgi:hypothetical protein
MDHRDQELLDKQLRHVQSASRGDGLIMPVLLAAFFTGMALGGFFFAYAGEPMQLALHRTVPNQQVAANEVPIFVPQGGHQGTARQ